MDIVPSLILTGKRSHLLPTDLGDISAELTILRRTLPLSLTILLVPVKIASFARNNLKTLTGIISTGANAW